MNELPLLIASVTLVGFSAHQLSLMQLSARVTTPFYYCLYLFLINYLLGRVLLVGSQNVFGIIHALNLIGTQRTRLS